MHEDQKNEVNENGDVDMSQLGPTHIYINEAVREGRLQALDIAIAAVIAASPDRPQIHASIQRMIRDLELSATEPRLPNWVRASAQKQCDATTSHLKFILSQSESEASSPGT
jgi:hypothetical protein